MLPHEHGGTTPGEIRQRPSDTPGTSRASGDWQASGGLGPAASRPAATRPPATTRIARSVSRPGDTGGLSTGTAPCARRGHLAPGNTTLRTHSTSRTRPVCVRTKDCWNPHPQDPTASCTYVSITCVISLGDDAESISGGREVGQRWGKTRPTARSVDFVSHRCHIPPGKAQVRIANVRVGSCRTRRRWVTSRASGGNGAGRPGDTVAATRPCRIPGEGEGVGEMAVLAAPTAE